MVGAVPTGDAPTTSEWSTILLPTKVRLILEVLRYVTCLPRSQCIDSLAPGRPGCHFKTAIFNLVLLIAIFTSSKDNALRLMPRDLTDDKSTLVQVMAWCHQATSHYLSQCWLSSMSPYDVSRPQWIKQTNDWCRNKTINISWSDSEKTKSGTKPNLVAKILATNFGVFL